MINTLQNFFIALFFTASIGFLSAQEVSIPDPGLEAAVRNALQKPAGPLTSQDLHSLTILDATSRGITNIAGLEAASHLTILDLFNNQLANFELPVGMTNLTILDVGFNALTNFSLPDGLSKLDTLFLEDNRLRNFTLPEGLSALTQLEIGRAHV